MATLAIDLLAGTRKTVMAEVGHFTPDIIVVVMLQKERKWNSVAAFVQDILRLKREEGCL